MARKIKKNIYVIGDEVKVVQKTLAVLIRHKLQFDFNTYFIYKLICEFVVGKMYRKDIVAVLAAQQIDLVSTYIL